MTGIFFSLFCDLMIIGYNELIDRLTIIREIVRPERCCVAVAVGYVFSNAVRSTKRMKQVIAKMS